MQLILDSEPALDIKRDMSAVEDIHTDKVGNGNIEKLMEKNCNGNKENIGAVNVNSSDDKNKVVVNGETGASPNMSIEEKSEHTEDESSLEVANTETTCKVNKPEENGAQIEESLNNGADEEIPCTSPIEKESEEKSKDTIAESAENIISYDQEHLDQIPDTTENKSEKAEPESNDETQVEKELPGAKNNVEVLEKPTETHATCESTLIVELKESVPEIQSEEPASAIENEDKPLESSENKEKAEDSKDKEKQLEENKNDIEEPVCDAEAKSTNGARDPSPIELKDEIEAPLCDTEVKPTNEARAPSPIELKDEIEASVCDPEVKTTNEALAPSPIELKDEIEASVSDPEVKPTNEARAPSPIELKDDMDVEEIVESANSQEKDTDSQPKEKPSAPVSSNIDKPVLCKLSNTLDILSDDEDEPPKTEPPKTVDLNEKQCINIEDDDDIMLIDEDTTKTETTQPVNISDKDDTPINTENKTDSETGEKAVEGSIDLVAKTDEKDSTLPEKVKDTKSNSIFDKKEDSPFEPVTSELPLLPDNFLKSAKKNISDMTREDLEEFCILKIVESIVDRSNLSEIKNKLKTVAQGIDEYRKKTMALTKQNRDLQVVLKSIQEEQKKNLGVPITPLKITRSVGMQVYMEKSGPRRKNVGPLQNTPNTRPKAFPSPNIRPQKPPAASSQPIPVPRLVPASPMKSPSTIPMVNQIVPAKTVPSMPNGIKNPSPAQKMAEKRQRNRTLSVTVDLTDDEPPAKVNNRASPAPPVRLVPSQSLMANPRQAFPQAVSSPRKVYIPISGPQNQNVRAGQTIMLKTVPTPGLRPKVPNSQVARPQSVRLNRHPAPLPDAMKQYQPPNWKALPPAPDLKLSKVENGIVISWKIEGYQEDSYEEIASYQLYAYQETSSPPSTALWKKIGDVKALPLPMACTLTQFMAGFKYFFAVRAVDIRSRLGPFSLPGSILLLNKL